MHTIHVIGSKTLGGAERFFIRLIQGLADMGHKTQAAVRAGYEVGEHIPKNVTKHELPMRSVWDPLSKFELKNLVKKERPQIVQTYMGRATRLLHLKQGKAPVHIARLGGYYKLKNFAHAHAWIGNTKGLCDFMIEAGFPADRVFHISNFIEVPRPVSSERLQQLRHNLLIPDEAWILLTAGRFVDVKGHFELLKAFSMAPKSIADRPLYLIMLGNGPLEPKLKKHAEGLGIEKRIIWPGWQTNPEPYFQLADIIVFTSRQRETLGNVILEAWASERPVLATQFQGALEICEHGSDTWLVPCEDSKAIAQGIELMLRDERLRLNMARNGHKKILAKYSKEKVLKEYLNTYNLLLERLEH